MEIKIINFNHKTFSNWGVIKHDVPQGSDLDSLLFLLYVNDFGKCKLIVYADDTSIILTNSNLIDFKND